MTTVSADRQNTNLPPTRQNLDLTAKYGDLKKCRAFPSVAPEFSVTKFRRTKKISVNFQAFGLESGETGRATPFYRPDWDLDSR